MPSRALLLTLVAALAVLALPASRRRAAASTRAVARRGRSVAASVSSAGGAAFAALRALIEREEGRKGYVYDDVTGKPWGQSRKGKPTIGVGHVVKASEPQLYAFTPASPMTDAEIDALLVSDMAWASRVVDALPVRLTANQRAALISLVFNIGEGNFAKSLVRRHLLAGDFTAAAAAFRNFHRGNGIPGRLLPRREREIAHFKKA